MLLQVRPFPLAKRWAYLIIDEFTQQGDTEKRLNLPVSPMCDRDTLATDGQKAKMQMDFMDYVVTPMYLSPSLSLSVCVCVCV